jgi:hypothetical protein
MWTSAMFYIFLVVGVLTSTVVGNATQGTGESCGYDTNTDELLVCKGGLYCSEEQVCTKWHVKRYSRGDTCGVDLHNGAVDLECDLSLACVDGQCVFVEHHVGHTCDGTYTICADPYICDELVCKEEEYPLLKRVHRALMGFF